MSQEEIPGRKYAQSLGGANTTDSCKESTVGKRMVQEENEAASQEDYLIQLVKS